MDIATLKEEARTLEQQGRAADALAIYRKVLAHLEGTSAILRELPLYVKAGDLNLKLGDAKTAVAMYERAAKRYAQHGSGKSVVALCTKVLRVDPERTYVYLTHARLMIERGHVAEAVKVLAAYSERTRLGKAREVLQRISEGDEQEVRPVLEMLLEVAGRAESARLKAAVGVEEEPAPEAAASDDTSDVAQEEAEALQPGVAEEPPSESAGELEAGAPAEPARPREDISGWIAAEPSEELRARAEARVAEEEPADEIAMASADDAVEGEGEVFRGEEEQAPLADSVEETPLAVSDLASQPESEEPSEDSAEVVEPPASEKPVTPTPGYAPKVGPGIPSEDKPVTPKPGYAPKVGAGGIPLEEKSKPSGIGVSQTIEPPLEADKAPKESERAEPEAPREPRPARPVTRTGPRRQLTFTTERRSSSKSKWIWMVVGIVAVGGAGAGLVMGGVIGGGSDSPDSQGAAPLGTDTAEVTPNRSDSGASRPQPLDPSPALGDSLAEAVATLTTPDVVPDSLRQIEPSAATIDPAVSALTDTAAQDTVGDPLPGTESTRRLVLIEGLQVQSV
ncbi:MAG: hypothetical protein JSW51_04155, partial [Gemmatimonadota bacterium]